MGVWQTEELEKCVSAIIDYRGKTPTKTASEVDVLGTWAFESCKERSYRNT